MGLNRVLVIITQEKMKGCAMKNCAVICLITSCFFVQTALSMTGGSPSPLSGRINGIDVDLDQAVFADRVLRIETKGSDGFAARLSVHLPIAIGVVPELKTFSTADHAKVATSSKQVKVMHYWKDLVTGKTVFAFMKRGEYQLELEFGEETERGISGYLSLENPGLDVKVAGNFVAEIRGLRLVNGHPDLQCDHYATLIHVAELYLRKKTNTEAVKISNVKDHKYSLKAGDKKAGWLDGEYKDGDGQAVFVRLQFIKNDEGWEVFRELGADQLVTAHPIVPFDMTRVEDDDGMVDTKILNFLTARALEADLQKEFPGKGVSAHFGLSFAFNPKTGIGYNKASYSLDGVKERFSKTYLLRRADGLWRVERALKDGEKVNTRTGKVEQFASAGGKTLCEVAAKGDTELVTVLLEKNADVNAKDTKGVTPLVYAASGGYEQIVTLLLDWGANANAMAKDGRRPLYISVARGDLHIARLLVDAKADVNIKNGHGSTALHTAAVWDRHEIADLLIEAGADVNALDGQGNAALDLAQWWASNNTAKLLKANRADAAKGPQQKAGLMGRVRGMDMIASQATLDAGMFLHFHGSKGRLNPPVVTLFLKGTHGVLPLGRSMALTRGDMESVGFVNNVLYKFATETKGRERSDWLGHKGYDLSLAFGHEKAGSLQGEILLESPEDDVRLKGKFGAKIIGLRMVDGHPDLKSDSLETLRYAAELYIQDKLGRDDITVSNAGGNGSLWYNNVDQKQTEQFGGADVHYRVGDDREQFLRVQLRKGADGWRVARELKGNELRPAHPLAEVDKNDSGKYFLYLVARRLERDLQKAYPNSHFRTEMHASRRVSTRHGIAQVELRYYILGSDKRYSGKYLLRRVGDDWTVDRSLSENEKLNTRTGAIEKN